MSGTAPRLIGFSTGVFYPHTSIAEAVRHLRTAGVTAIEIGPDLTDPRIASSAEGADALREVDCSGCSYVSHHAPSLPYGTNAVTRDAFAHIADLHRLQPLDAVVFHPDTVEDFAVFHNLPFPVAFENMDWRKSAYRTSEELAELLARDQAWGMVLDINHIYTYDPTLSMLAEFVRCCGDRLVEIHLSGFATLHDPLHQTEQGFLVDAVANLPGQVIVESQLPLDGLEREWTYIADRLARGPLE